MCKSLKDVRFDQKARGFNFVSVIIVSCDEARKMKSERDTARDFQLRNAVCSKINLSMCEL